MVGPGILRSILAHRAEQSMTPLTSLVKEGQVGHFKIKQSHQTDYVNQILSNEYLLQLYYSLSCDLQFKFSLQYQLLHSLLYIECLVRGLRFSFSTSSLILNEQFFSLCEIFIWDYSREQVYTLTFNSDEDFNSVINENKF